MKQKVVTLKIPHSFDKNKFHVVKKTAGSVKLMAKVSELNSQLQELYAEEAKMLKQFDPRQMRGSAFFHLKQMVEAKLMPKKYLVKMFPEAVEYYALAGKIRKLDDALFLLYHKVKQAEKALVFAQMGRKMPKPLFTGKLQQEMLLSRRNRVPSGDFGRS